MLIAKQILCVETHKKQVSEEIKLLKFFATLFIVNSIL